MCSRLVPWALGQHHARHGVTERMGGFYLLKPNWLLVTEHQVWVAGASKRMVSVFCHLSLSFSLDLRFSGPLRDCQEDSLSSSPSLPASSSIWRRWPGQHCAGILPATPSRRAVPRSVYLYVTRLLLPAGLAAASPLQRCWLQWHLFVTKSTLERGQQWIEFHLGSKGHSVFYMLLFKSLQIIISLKCLLELYQGGLFWVGRWSWPFVMEMNCAGESQWRSRPRKEPGAEALAMKN